MWGDEHQLTAVSQVDALSREDVDGLFSDGRKSVTGDFVPVDIDKVVAARLGRNKPPLKVLWAQYLQVDSPGGRSHYGYERFCQIVAEHVRVNDLTAPIQHVPGHTMQVDWAGTRMQIVDPISGQVTPVSVFVASLPYSGSCSLTGVWTRSSPPGLTRTGEHSNTSMVSRCWWCPIMHRRRRTRSVRVNGPET